jgi:hypothetical protein
MLTDRFINASQVGGIDSYTADDSASGVRMLCVSTGGGFRYRVLVDRGLDIDQAFLNQHSLTFLTHRGVTPPSQGLARGLDWLRGFPGGLLTSCGPFNIGAPSNDAGEELGLHGEHSHTPATIESIIQPDPRRGRLDMTIVGVMRYGHLYGRNVTLRRTIYSRLGENWIDFTDEFFNEGNVEVPHAWLLHINFGWPLLDAGAEFCYDAAKVEPMSDHDPSAKAFAPNQDFKRVIAPSSRYDGDSSIVGYIYPRADRAGVATVGIANAKLGIGVAIRYSTKEFRRCANWQHLARGEYVAALEPANGSVEGRAIDRERGEVDSIKAGGTKTYRYRIEAVSGDERLDELLKLNRKQPSSAHRRARQR